MHPAGDHRRSRGGGRGNEEAVVAGEGRGRRLRGRAGILVAAAALAVGYAGTALAARDRVPAGAAVAGVRVGGLDRAAAVRLLQQRLGGAPAAVTVRAGVRTAQLDRAEAGLSFDPERVVGDLFGAPLAPAAVWRRLAGTAAAMGRAAGADPGPIRRASPQP